MTVAEKLREFIENKYLNTTNERGGIILQEDIDALLDFAEADNVERKMLEYSNKNPDASFWDYAQFLQIGALHGVTQEELLEYDE